MSSIQRLLQESDIWTFPRDFESTVSELSRPVASWLSVHGQEEKNQQLLEEFSTSMAADIAVASHYLQSGQEIKLPFNVTLEHLYFANLKANCDVMCYLTAQNSLSFSSMREDGIVPFDYIFPFTADVTKYRTYRGIFLSLLREAMQTQIDPGEILPNFGVFFTQVDNIDVLSRFQQAFIRTLDTDIRRLMIDSGVREGLADTFLKIIGFEAICWTMSMMIFALGRPFVLDETGRISSAIRDLASQIQTLH